MLTLRSWGCFSHSFINHITGVRTKWGWLRWICHFSAMQLRSLCYIISSDIWKSHLTIWSRYHKSLAGWICVHANVIANRHTMVKRSQGAFLWLFTLLLLLTGLVLRKYLLLLTQRWRLSLLSRISRLEIFVPGKLKERCIYSIIIVSKYIS